jgi:hypothetical protein
MALFVENHHAHLGSTSRNQVIEHLKSGGTVSRRALECRFGQPLGAMEHRAQVALQTL